MSQDNNPESAEYDEDHHKYHHKQPHHFKGKNKYFKHKHHEHIS